MLALQAMLLLMIMLVASSTCLSVRRGMCCNIILVALEFGLVHIIEHFYAQFNIAEQLVASALAEILSNYYSQHLQVISMRRHSVSWNDPASTSELMCERELVIVSGFVIVEAERHQWETSATLLGHDDEAKLFERLREIVGCAGEVRHDRAVTMLSKADELVVLPDDLGGTLGKVECE